MEKVEDKIFDLLTSRGVGLTESQISEELDISHGSFYNAIRSLTGKGLVDCFRNNRAKIYVRSNSYQVTNYDKPPDSGTAKSSAKSEKISIKMYEHDDLYQGIFPSVQAFLDSVTGLEGFQWADRDGDYIVVSVDDEDGGNLLLRYDYDVLPKSAGVEVWRYRIKQTYKRRGRAL